MNFLKKNKNLLTPVFVISAILLLLIILSVIFAPLIAPYDPEELDLANKLQGISPEHIFGTDKVGRDIFSRALYGGKTTMLSAFAVVLISIVIGIPVGLVSGYYGGKVDMVTNSVWNIILSFPSILLAFVLMGVMGKGILAGIIALGIVYIPMISRLTRSITMVEKNKTYVEAAKVLGFRNARILFRHILPNCISTIMAELTIDLAYAILDLAGLSFLGVGVQPPQSDWGYMISDSQQYLTSNPIQALVPGILIIVVVITLNLLSNEIATHTDAKLRKTGSFRKYRRQLARKKKREQKMSAKVVISHE